MKLCSIASPEDEDKDQREVETEIEDNDNNNLTIPQVANCLGMVFFPLVLLTWVLRYLYSAYGHDVVQPDLFIILVMFLPISLLLHDIELHESMVKTGNREGV